jgi:hypothetical protein
MKFESMGLGTDWTPEYHLKSHAFRNYQYRHATERLIPDGVLIEPYEGKELKIAIELELTRKSEARYKFIFREYSERLTNVGAWMARIRPTGGRWCERPDARPR